MAIDLDYASYININSLTSDNLTYKSLNKTPSSLAKLATLFDPESNDNVRSYGNGTHASVDRIINKIEDWSQKTESHNPLRAFFVYETDKNEAPIGMMNLGFSNTYINNAKLIEGGALFDDDYNNSTLPTEALTSVYVDYLNTLVNDNVVKSPGFIYTVSQANPLYNHLENSELKHLTFGNQSSAEHNCIFEALETNPLRFKVDQGASVISDFGRAVEVFYYLYDDSICASNAIDNTNTAETLTNLTVTNSTNETLTDIVGNNSTNETLIA